MTNYSIKLLNHKKALNIYQALNIYNYVAMPKKRTNAGFGQRMIEMAVKCMVQSLPQEMWSQAENLCNNWNYLKLNIYALIISLLITESFPKNYMFKPRQKRLQLKDLTAVSAIILHASTEILSAISKPYTCSSNTNCFLYKKLD